MKTKLYLYGPCSTCRRAVKWLKSKEINFEERAIRETPPSAAELRAMLAAYGGDLRRLFNTSGQDYRAMGLKDRLSAMQPAEAFALMAKNGNLVRRPFLVGEGVALVGFSEEAWEKAWGGRG